MWKDQETKIDLVNYAGIAGAIVGLIDDGDLSPLTVGVHGDWGSGKSSILAMVQETLTDSDDIAVLSFNGWLFQGFEDAKIALMESIVQELAADKKFGSRIKDAALDLLRRIDWLKTAKKAASVALAVHTAGASLLVEKALDAVTGDSKEDDGKLLRDAEKRDVTKQIHEFREHFRKLLAEANIRQLVVIVDDLDRCLPSTAIDTLEALRLFLFVDRTVFIVAADEAMIEYAVREHFPGLPYSEGPAAFTRNYLEKLIQIPFRLPPMSAEEARSYIALLFTEAALRGQPGAFDKILAAVASQRKKPWEPTHIDLRFVETTLGAAVKLDDSIREQLLIADRVSRPLASGTRGNPRQIKRFLNTLMLRLRLAIAYGLKDAINAGVLSKLMLLERANPTLYRTLVDLVRISQDGKVPGIDIIGPAPAQTEVESPERVSGETADPTASAIIELPDVLLKSSAFYEWSQIEPKLGNVDLRGYLFVSRERTPGFIGAAEFLDLPSDTLRRFLTGTDIEIAALHPELKSLPHDKAEALLDAGLTELRTRADLKERPAVLNGLGALVSVHADLQRRLLEAIADYPADRIGAWLPFYLRGTFTDASNQRALQQLEQRLRDDGDNALKEALAAAARRGKR